MGSGEGFHFGGSLEVLVDFSLFRDVLVGCLSVFIGKTSKRKYSQFIWECC